MCLLIEYIYSKVHIKIINDEEEMIDIFSTEWFHNIRNSTTSGQVVKIYRENLNVTQEQLGKKLGKFTRQNISDIELGRRSISKKVAKKLSAFFDVSVERFI